MRFLLFLPGILLLILSAVLWVKKSDDPTPPQQKDDAPDVFIGYIIDHDHKRK